MIELTDWLSLSFLPFLSLSLSLSLSLLPSLSLSRSLSLSCLLSLHSSTIKSYTTFFLFLLLLFPLDATKFKEEFDRCKALNNSPTKPAAEDKLTEEMDKLKVEDKEEEEEKDADNSSGTGGSGDPKSGESSGEGVKSESSTTDATGDSAKKDDEQTDQQSGPAEWLRKKNSALHWKILWSKIKFIGKKGYNYNIV